MKRKAIIKKVVSVLLVLALVFTSVNLSDINTYAATKNTKKYVKTLKVSKRKVTMNVGKTKKIKVTIKTKGKVSKKFTAKSSNKKIAKVTIKKSTIVIKGKKAGKAKITIKTKAKNKKGKKIKKVINVTVKKKKTTANTTNTSKPNNSSNIPKPNNTTNQTNNDKGYTRGEWIKLLSNTFGFADNSSLSDVNYEFADTLSDNEYGYLAEVANVYGIIPECDAEGFEDPDQDVPLFESSKKVTREYAAYTIVQALGFEIDENVTLNASDASTTKYELVDAMAVHQQLISLQNGKFNPKSLLDRTTGAKMLNKAQAILDSEEIDTDETVSEVTYQSGVTDVTDLDSQEIDIEENNDNIRISLPIDESTKKLQVGDIFVVPSNDTFVNDTAYKIEEIESSSDSELILLCSMPEIEEVVSNIEYSGAVNPTKLIFEPSDGVIVEDEPAVYNRARIGINETFNPKAEVALSVDKSVGDLELSGKVNITIPEIKCKIKADIGWRGIDFEQFLLSIKEQVKLTGELSYTLAESGYELTNGAGNTRWESGNVELGRIPIEIGAGISFDIVFFWQLDAKGTVSISYTIEATQGIQLVNGSLRAIKDFKQNLDSLSLKGSFETGVGIALVVDAFNLMDLVGVDFALGLGASISFTPHILSNLYCGDAKLYLYGTATLSEDTALGKFLKETKHMNLEWTLYDENNSPLKKELHVENCEIVDKCTYGAGSIEGKVVNQDGATITQARVELYKNDVLMQKKYSGSGGNFKFEDLTEGDYLLKVSATGANKYEVAVSVQKAQTTYTEVFIMVDRNNSNYNGVAEGNIINAVTGEEIDNVTYKVRKNWNNTTGTVIETGTVDGYYDILLSPGNYTIQFSANGYVDTEINIAIYADGSSYKTVAISPELVADDDLIRIVLTWGEEPYDLDSHLIGPTYNGEDQYHIYYSDDYYYDEDYDGNLADLDIDDTDSYGPETITIHTLNEDGVYKYYVYDYENGIDNDNYSTALSSSNAQVRVYRGKTLLKKFNVPTNSDGTLWHVFNYDVATDTIIPINDMSYETSSNDIGQ